MKFNSATVMAILLFYLLFCVTLMKGGFETQPIVESFSQLLRFVVIVVSIVAVC